MIVATAIRDSGEILGPLDDRSSSGSENSQEARISGDESHPIHPNKSLDRHAPEDLHTFAHHHHHGHHQVTSHTYFTECHFHHSPLDRHLLPFRPTHLPHLM